MMTGIDTMRTEDDHMAQDNPFGLDDDDDGEEEKKSAPQFSEVPLELVG